MIQAYCDFIKYALDEQKPLPVCFDLIDWREFMTFCLQHGILGVVYAGLERADRRIPQIVLFEWISYVESIKHQNQTVSKRSVSVSKWFEKKGLHSIILKGQANGLMYPQPELRSPGDIDIWVDASRIDIIRMIIKEFPEADYSIHHIKAPLFKDVSVEVHYRPIYMKNWFVDKKLQKYVDTIRNTQFSHQVLIDGQKIGSLTYSFNIIYQLLHMYAHFFSTRNNFKQFIDYYYLLREYRADISINDEIKSVIKDLGVMKYAKGMMWVMKEALGIDEKYLVVEADEKIGKIILRESMHYGTYSQNKAKKVFQQFIGNIRLATTFPKDVLINPFFLVWHQLWKVKIRRQL